MGFVEMTQGNFDLFNWPNFTGGGQKLRLRAQMGLLRQDYLLSFTEPWFLDRQLSFGFDLFHRYSSYLSGDFDERRTGGSLRLGKPLNQFTRFELQYTIQQIGQDIRSSDVSEEIRAESGNMLRSSLTASLVYDTRDSVFLSRRGQRTELSAEVVGGPLGGDVSLYKLSGHSSWYTSFFRDHILQFMVAGGVVDVFGQSAGRGKTVTETNGTVVTVNDVPMFDRFFLGGANTLRGFDYRKVSPKDVYGEPVGGNTFVQSTVEYTIPIVERIRFALFCDIGEVQRDVYEFSASDLKADIGAGFRLNLPVGPLRFDYGWPIMSDKQSGRTGRIQFSVGYQF
jgi:outer membrane protein insertion porin family